MHFSNSQLYRMALPYFYVYNVYIYVYMVEYLNICHAS